jgi:hypothetical protein
MNRDSTGSDGAPIYDRDFLLAPEKRKRWNCEPQRPVASDPVDALILDLLEWIGAEPRAYAEVMDAWRSSCPRLPVWEEATERGLVERRHREGTGAVVAVTGRGRELLRRHRPGAPGGVERPGPRRR